MKCETNIVVLSFKNSLIFVRIIMNSNLDLLVQCIFEFEFLESYLSNLNPVGSYLSKFEFLKSV